MTVTTGQSFPSLAPTSSRKATASLLLGLASLVVPFVLTPFALILGYLSLREIRQSGDQILGRTRAVLGILTSLLGIGSVIGLYGFGVPEVIEQRDRAGSRQNLQRIGAAMHEYHDAHGTFPLWARVDATGKPLLSWRVLILPYLGEQELYDEFHLDDPWDSPHNRPLLARMPKVYAHPRHMEGQEPATTYYQVFVGKKEMHVEHRPIFHEQQPSVSRREVTNADGEAATFLVVEAFRSVPWTKPADLTYAPSDPFRPLGGVFKRGFCALMADGSTKFLPRDLPEHSLRCLIEYNDGQTMAGPVDCR